MSDSKRKPRKAVASKKPVTARKSRLAKSPKKPTCVVVLGMHRSGTSALTGTLNLLGCTLPDVLIPGNSTNEKGHFESVKLRSFLDEILQSVASRWDDWHSIPTGWFDSSRADEFQAEAVNLLAEEYGPSRLFVLKNPRICRLLPFWNDVWGAANVDPAFVLIHRNPTEVAASLERRNGMDTQLSLLIWLRHVIEAEIGTRGCARSFTSYRELMQNWHHTATKLQSDLKLSFPRFSLGVTEEVEEFLSPTLRHFNETADSAMNDPIVSGWVRDVFAILERWTDQGENSKDHAQLDHIRTAFNAAAPTFARIVQKGRELSESLTQTQETLVEQTQQQSDLQDSLASMEAQFERFKMNQDAMLLQADQTRLDSEATQKAAQGREADLKDEIAALKLKNVQAERSVKQFTFETNEGKRLCEDLRQKELNATTALDTQRLQSEIKYKEHQDALEQTANSLTDHITQLEFADQANKDAAAAFANLQDSNMRLQDDLLTSNTERETQVKRDQSSKADQEEHIQKLLNELKNAQAKLKTTEVERDQNSQSVTARYGEIEIITRNIMVLNGHVTNLKDEVSEKNEKLDAQIKSQKAMKDDLSQTQSALRQRSHEADETAKLLEQTKNEVSDYQAWISRLEEDTQTQKTQIGELIQDFTTKRKKNGEEQQNRFDEITSLTKRIIEQETNFQGRLERTTIQLAELGKALTSEKQLSQTLLDEKKSLLPRLEASEKLSIRVVDALSAILDTRTVIRHRLPLLANKSKARLIEALGLFDRSWYQSINSDVREAGVDPAMHFVRHGYAEGRAPTPEIERQKAATAKK